MKVTVQATIYEGFSDSLIGKQSGHVEAEYDLPAIPRKDDWIETPGGSEYPVQYVFWGRDGSVVVTLAPIYTGSESQESVIAEWATPTGEPT